MTTIPPLFEICTLSKKPVFFPQHHDLPLFGRHLLLRWLQIDFTPHLSDTNTHTYSTLTYINIKLTALGVRLCMCINTFLMEKVLKHLQIRRSVKSRPDRLEQPGQLLTSFVMNMIDRSNFVDLTASTRACPDWKAIPISYRICFSHASLIWGLWTSNQIL